MDKKRGNGRGRSSLMRRAKRGMRGYPVATIAYYGPDDQFASKVAVGIVAREGDDVIALERWYSEDVDIRQDPDVTQAILEFIEQYDVKSVLATDGILGCPHEEGIDYPLGESCPECPFWADHVYEDRGQAAGEDVQIVAGCAWFDEEGWERLREVTADPERLEDDYETWVAMVEKSIRDMRDQGVELEKVLLDVDELVAWCEEQDRPVDASARADLAAEKLRERHEGS